MKITSSYSSAATPPADISLEVGDLVKHPDNDVVLLVVKAPEHNTKLGLTVFSGVVLWKSPTLASGMKKVYTECDANVYQKLPSGCVLSLSVE